MKTRIALGVALVAITVLATALVSQGGAEPKGSPAKAEPVAEKHDKISLIPNTPDEIAHLMELDGMFKQGKLRDAACIRREKAERRWICSGDFVPHIAYLKKENEGMTPADLGVGTWSELQEEQTESGAWNVMVGEDGTMYAESRD